MERKQIRVLHVFGAMNRGGAESLMMNVYRKINRHLIQFDFCVHTDQYGHFDEEIRSLGGGIFNLPSPREIGFSKYEMLYSKVLEENPSIKAVHSHVHHFSGHVLKVAKRSGVNMRIAHSHSTMDGQHDHVIRRIYRWMMQRSIKDSATHLMGCTSDACVALFGKGAMQDERVTLIHNAIDLTPFEQASYSKRELRKQLDLPIDSMVIGHVGGFRPTKNHKFLLQLFASIRNQIPNAYLVLVGDGALRSQIEEQIQSLQMRDRVFLLGIRSDVHQLMASFDVFVFPSVYEGLPTVLVEAQAAGTPCVVSKTVSAEADLGMDLLEYVELDSSLAKWKSALVRGLNKAAPDWKQRKQTLQTMGFEIERVTHELERIYSYAQ